MPDYLEIAIALISVLNPWVTGKIEISQIVDSWISLVLAFWCGVSLILLVLPRILNKCGL